MASATSATATTASASAGRSWVIPADAAAVVATNTLVAIEACRLDRQALHGQIRPINEAWVQERAQALRLNQPAEPLSVLLAQADAAGVFRDSARTSAQLLSLSSQGTPSG